MGVSTDGILFYGFVWEDETDLFDNDDDKDEIEWQEIIAIKRGHENPWIKYPPELENAPYSAAREANSKAWMDAHRSELDAWYEIKKKIQAEFGCDINYHCSGECPIPYISVNESRRVAHRGSPREVESLNIKPEWDSLLTAFVEALGLEVPHEKPKWVLASMWH